jgi:cobalt-zinc-cadmium efflux system outer membrane protein
MMKRIIFIVAIIFIFFLSIISYSEQEEVKPITIKEAIGIALERNPDIKAALKDYEAARARIYRAKAFPEPELSWEFDFQPRFFGLKDAGERNLSISQLFEFPGRRHFRYKVAEKEALISQAGYNVARLDLIAQVRIAFHAVLLAGEKVNYNQQNLKLSQNFLRMAQIRYEAGSVAKLEVLRARVEEAKARNELNLAENELDLSKAALNFLLARPMETALQIEGKLEAQPLQPSLEELQKKAFNYRPEIIGVHHAVDGARSALSLAKLSYAPDFGIRAGQHWASELGNTWDIEFGINLPIFFWQRQKGEVAEARAHLYSLTSVSESTKNRIGLEVKDAFLRVAALKNRIQLFQEEILVEAREAYRIAVRSYEEGEIGNLELLEGQRTLMEVNLSYADALFEYHVALAELEKAVGGGLL